MDGVSQLIREIKEGQETVFDLIGDNGDSVKRVEISRRQLQPELPLQKPEPPIARAQAVAHEFHDVEAFCEYLIRNAEKGASVVLADVGTRTITAILNEADQEDRETVSLVAIQHPLFTPWQGLLNRAVPVVDFAMFVMQHRRAVVEPNGREVAMIFSQVKMSKAITMYSGTGKKSLNGVIVELEIAGERKGTPVELPETIAIEAPLFVGTSPQKIEIDLLVTNQGENVVVFGTAADVESAKIAAFEEMVDFIKQKTQQLVGLGKVQQRPWKTVS